MCVCVFSFLKKIYQIYLCKPHTLKQWTMGKDYRLYGNPLDKDMMLQLHKQIITPTPTPTKGIKNCTIPFLFPFAEISTQEKKMCHFTNFPSFHILYLRILALNSTLNYSIFQVSVIFGLDIVKIHWLDRCSEDSQYTSDITIFI